MNPWVILAAVVAMIVITGLAYFEGKETGRQEVIAENTEAIAKKTRETAAMVAAHAKELQDFQSKLDQLERTANAKIRKLLSENAELRRWWEMLVPADAADYAWGLRDDLGGGPVPGRSVVAGTDPH